MQNYHISQKVGMARTLLQHDGHRVVQERTLNNK